ncbi:MAG: hypothetical protein U5L72_13480 [Bacteroidales bacterium]|nr:hypothetical protein [Bacteroidales bacterium]
MVMGFLELAYVRLKIYRVIQVKDAVKYPKDTIFIYGLKKMDTKKWETGLEKPAKAAGK